MIARHWRGVAKPEHAEAYIQHLKTETFPSLHKLPGFVRASILRRSIPAGDEFLIITIWQSLESIRAFAGRDIETAVVPAAVEEMMVDYDRAAHHFEVVD
jgi:heme-degrading monooxygenase HmoA